MEEGNNNVWQQWLMDWIAQDKNRKCFSRFCCFILNRVNAKPVFSFYCVAGNENYKHYFPEVSIYLFLFIYLGFYVAFNTVQVISRPVVGRAEEAST